MNLMQSKTGKTRMHVVGNFKTYFFIIWNLPKITDFGPDTSIFCRTEANLISKNCNEYISRIKNILDSELM